MYTKQLKLAGLSLLVWSTFSIADNQATSDNRAVLISVVGSKGSPVDANIAGSVRQLVGHAVANGILDTFNVYLPESGTPSPTDGSFTGCADAGANTSQDKFSDFVSKLQTISAKAPTVYNIQTISGCNTLNVDPFTCSLNGGNCPTSAATSPISATTSMAVGTMATLTNQASSTTYTPHCQTLSGGNDTCYFDKYYIARHPAPSGGGLCVIGTCY